MNEIQDVKFVAITPPAAIIDNAAAVTTAVDTLGWDYITIVVQLGATDIAMAVLKVQESLVSGSGFADITGANFATGTDINGVATALPSATNDNTFFVFQIDLKARLRYIDLVATVGDGAAGTFISAFAILSKAEQAPTTVAGHGCAGLIRIP